MTISPDPAAPSGESPGPLDGGEEGSPTPLAVLPMANPKSAGAGNVPALLPQGPPVAPRHVPRGVVVFDLDGTLLDDLKLISHVAGEVLREAFGTPPEEGRVHYLATTGMPFEAQLAQLYPDAPVPLRLTAARTFHARKVAEAYAYAHPFPEVPKLLKRLEAEGWTLVISTGAEREMAELLLEREGIRIWFEAVLGSAQGTKREHLSEYRRRYPSAPIFLVGDSRFDLECARDEGVAMLARAGMYSGWTLSPEDFRAWGAAWADFSLAALPEVLGRLGRAPRARTPRRTASARAATRPPRPPRALRAPRRKPRRRRVAR